MSASQAALIVLAKEPIPGRVKTRLCPPYRPAEAAALALAALTDTLAAAAAVPAARHVLVLEGTAGDWLPPMFEVIPQQPGNLARRLAAAFVAVGSPAVLIGMDTPQVTTALLGEALDSLARPTVDAVLGLADDGGYWTIGLNDPSLPVFDGVPMSSNSTGGMQLARLHDHGLRVGLLPQLRDVDAYSDAAAVASAAPGTHFAAAFARLGSRLAPA